MTDYNLIICAAAVAGFIVGTIVGFSGALLLIFKEDEKENGL